MSKMGLANIELMGVILILFGQLGFLLWGAGLISNNPILSWIGFGIVSVLATVISLIVGFPK